MYKTTTAKIVMALF